MDATEPDRASAVDRAHELRATLGARRDVEAALAEAGALRQQAAADADAIVDEAQQVAQALLAESRQQAAQITGQARERAEGIVERARADAAEVAQQARDDAATMLLEGERRADEHRAQVRSELAEQGRRTLAHLRQRSDELIGEAEGAVRGLSLDLEAAGTKIAQVLDALGRLRESTAALPTPTAQEAAPPGAEVPASSAFGSDHPPVPAVAAPAPAFDVPEPSVASFAQVTPAEVPEPSVASFAEVPRAEVPRAEVPEPSVASFAEVPRAEPVEPVDSPATREVPVVPLARTEPETTSIFAAARAELESDRSRHAGGATARAAGHDDRISERRGSGETLEAVAHTERAGQRESELASRPLGWLFRSGQ